MAYKYPEYPDMEYVNGLSDAQKEELMVEMEHRRAHAMEMHEKNIEAELQASASESVGKEAVDIQAEVDRIAALSPEELEKEWLRQEAGEAQAGVKKSAESEIPWFKNQPAKKILKFS